MSCTNPFSEEVVILRPYDDGTNCRRWRSVEKVCEDVYLYADLLDLGGRKRLLSVEDLRFGAARRLVRDIYTTEGGCLEARYIRPPAFTDAPPFTDRCDVCAALATTGVVPRQLKITIEGVTNCVINGFPTNGSAINGTWTMEFDAGLGLWYYADPSVPALGSVEIGAICFGDGSESNPFRLLVVGVTWWGEPGFGTYVCDAFHGEFLSPVDPTEEIGSVNDCADTCIFGEGGTAVLRLGDDATCCGGAEEDAWPETIQVTISGATFQPMEYFAADDCGFAPWGNYTNIGLSLTCSREGWTPSLGRRYYGIIALGNTDNCEGTGVGCWSPRHGCGTQSRCGPPHYEWDYEYQNGFRACKWNQVIVLVEGLQEDCRVRVYASQLFNEFYWSQHPCNPEEEPMDCSPEAGIGQFFNRSIFFGEGTVAEATGAGIAAWRQEPAPPGPNQWDSYGGLCTITL